jgi:Fic family protein
MTTTGPFNDALRRAQTEFLEMPGLTLTVAQTARLLSVDEALCRRVLSALVESRFLAETPTSRFVRASH